MSATPINEIDRLSMFENIALDEAPLASTSSVTQPSGTAGSFEPAPNIVDEIPNIESAPLVTPNTIPDSATKTSAVDDLRKTAETIDRKINQVKINETSLLSVMDTFYEYDEMSNFCFYNLINLSLLQVNEKFYS